MAITVPPVRGAGDLGHVDDSNIVRQALLDLDAADAAIVQAAGNLLTANQASLEDGTTTGWVAANLSPTLAASTAQAASGTYSLLMTSTSTLANVAAGTPRGAGTVPVVPGRVYTATAAVYNASGARTVRVRILFWTSAGSYISVVDGATTTIGSAWSTLSASGVAPATAAFANVEIEFVNAGSVGDAVYVDKVGLWEGYGGVWAMPGFPIQGIGERWDAAGVWMWDTFENQETLVVARSGLPPVATTLPALPEDA